MFSQNVTSIEVIQESIDKIRIRWKSQLVDGEFSVYYNNKVIDDQFKLFDSELITSSNFTGENVGNIYQYEYIFSPREDGEYFFAVTGTDVRDIDQRARMILSGTPHLKDIVLIPELNTTIQPITIQSIKKAYTRFNNIQKQEIQIPLITSFELQSQEDVFNLRWSVHPKDKSQYVFIVYRSRYPIIQYGTPKGLPEYARVTNEFSFRDSNISYEVPYYYAVVSEKSTQWDSGINVFTQPAVLLRKSPAFKIKPIKEFVKKQENLSINIKNFSESEIAQAVQETLSNLHLIAETKSQQRSLEDILAPTVNDTGEILGLTNIEATPIFLQQQSSTIKTDDLNERKTKLDGIFQVFLGKIEEKKKELIKQKYKNYNAAVVNISNISSENKKLGLMEDQLLYLEAFSNKDLIRKLNEYYNLKDQISLMRHRIVGDIGNLNHKREIQEKNFLSMKSIFEKDVLDFEINNRKKLISDIDKKINQILVNQTNLEQYLSSKRVNNLMKGILIEASTAKEKDVFNPLVSTPSRNNSEDEIIQCIAKNKLQLNKLVNIKNELILDKIDPSKIEVINKTYNIDEIVNNKMEEINSYYKDVSVEEIPDVREVTNEKWLVVKEEWIQKNRNTLESKKDLWKRRTQEILGEDYNWIYSKWMIPSYNLALQEGRKAFQQKNYKEALYLLSFIPQDANAIMALGQSYYHLGAYKDALNVFVVTVHMNIPESYYWMDKTAKKILNRDI